MHKIWMSNLPLLLEVAASYGTNIVINSSSAYMDENDWVISVGTDTLDGAIDMNIWYEYNKRREVKS